MSIGSTQADNATGSDSTAGAVKEQATEKAQEIAGQAREQLGGAADQASQRVRAQVDQRSTEAGQKVSTQAQDLKSVAEALRKEGKDQPAQFAEQAAEKAERLGGYLESASADDILHDIEDFARRKPWAVGLGAAVLGFAGARFLKASSAQRYETRPTSPTGARAIPRQTTPRNGSGTYVNPSAGIVPGTPTTPEFAPPPPTPGTTPPTGF